MGPIVYINFINIVNDRGVTVENIISVDREGYLIICNTEGVIENKIDVEK